MQIEDYKLENAGKATIATFTIHAPMAKMRIRKCRLLKLKNGHYKISMPSFSEVPFAQRSSGDPVSFKQYIEFYPEKSKELEQKALEALLQEGFISEASSAPLPF